MLQQPFKSYRGGKSGNGTYQTIINHIPPFSTFIEAMAGNAGVAAHLNCSNPLVINDYDCSVYHIWRSFEAQINYHRDNSPLITNMHYRDLVAIYDVSAAPPNFFYFDPPYLKSTRKNKENIYKIEWTTNKHKEFLKIAMAVKSNCMISHYPCDLYNDLLSEWHKVTFKSTTRHGTATECIYMNYQLSGIVADYSYLGSNKMKRQAFKRKVSRWIASLNKMPATERNALIKEINKIYAVLPTCQR